MCVNHRTQTTVVYGLEHELLLADSSIFSRESKYQFFAAICGGLGSRAEAIGIVDTPKLSKAY